MVDFITPCSEKMKTWTPRTWWKDCRSGKAANKQPKRCSPFDSQPVPWVLNFLTCKVKYPEKWMIGKFWTWFWIFGGIPPIFLTAICCLFQGTLVIFPLKITKLPRTFPKHDSQNTDLSRTPNLHGFRYLAAGLGFNAGGLKFFFFFLAFGINHPKYGKYKVTPV